jgi:hypothetical protein
VKKKAEKKDKEEIKPEEQKEWFKHKAC